MERLSHASLVTDRRCPVTVAGAANDNPEVDWRRFGSRSGSWRRVWSRCERSHRYGRAHHPGGAHPGVSAVRYRHSAEHLQHQTSAGVRPHGADLRSVERRHRDGSCDRRRPPGALEAASNCPRCGRHLLRDRLRRYVRCSLRAVRRWIAGWGDRVLAVLAIRACSGLHRLRLGRLSCGYRARLAWIAPGWTVARAGPDQGDHQASSATKRQPRAEQTLRFQVTCPGSLDRF